MFPEVEVFSVWRARWKVGFDETVETLNKRRFVRARHLRETMRLVSSNLLLGDIGGIVWGYLDEGPVEEPPHHPSEDELQTMWIADQVMNYGGYVGEIFVV